MKIEEVLPHLRAGHMIEDENGARFKLQEGQLYNIQQGRAYRDELNFNYDRWEIIKEKVPHYHVIFVDIDGDLQISIYKYPSLEAAEKLITVFGPLRLLTEFPELIEMKEVD